MTTPETDPEPSLPRPESPEADALLTQVEQQLAIKRSARAMRKRNRVFYRLITLLLLVALLLGAVYALMMIDTLSTQPRPPVTVAP
jgi:cell division septal protein FtsQ